MIRITKVYKNMLDIHQKLQTRHQVPLKFSSSQRLSRNASMAEAVPWRRGGNITDMTAKWNVQTWATFTFFQLFATQHEEWHLCIISILSSKNNSDPRMSQKIHPRKANLLEPGPSLVYSCKSQLEPKRQIMPGNHQMSSGITTAHCFRYTSTKKGRVHRYLV